MSLQLAAQHLANHGRGKDTELVHMDKGELQSLRAIAQKHGGDLSVNPHTGLPEAGFLSAILPMVAGVALGPAGMGLTAMEAGLAGGALGMLTNPKAGLMGGLMAGFGAYGGANLGQSLALEGMKASVPTAAQVTPESLQPFTTDPTAYNAFKPTASTGGFGAFGEAPTGSQVVANNATSGGIGNMGSASLNPVGGNPATTIPAGGASNVSYGMTSTPGQPIAYSGGNAFYNTTLPTEAGSFQPSTITQPLATPTASAADLKDMSMSDRFSAMQKGLSGGNMLEFAKANPMQAAGLAGSVITAMPAKSAPAATTDKDMGQRYSYSPGRVLPQPAPDLNPNMGGGSGREQRYYTPSYTPVSTDTAKSIYGYADGGETSSDKLSPPKPGIPQFAMPSSNPNAAPLGLFAAMQAQTDAQRAAAPTPMNVAQEYSKYVQGLTAPAQTPAQQTAQAAVPSAAPNNTTQQPAPTSNTVSTGNLDNYSYTYDPITHSFTRSGVAGPATGPAPGYAAGGQSMGRNPVEQMSNQNSIGANTGFPQAYIHNNAFATPTQTPISQNVLTGPGDTGVDPYTGEQNMAMGGLSDARYNLGGYSDGGRLLRGPGDGVSDSIPAVIGKKQPARLADGEFVVPARIVSELGNGSTEAGARKLYAMMDRIQASRKKTVGKNRVAFNNKTDRHLPA